MANRAVERKAPARPVQPGSSARAALAEFFAAHQNLDLDVVAAELGRLRRISPLAHVIEAWDISFTDVAAMFSVSRQAVAKWVSSGVPPERSPAVADLAAATDLLVRHIRYDRIPAVVRRTAAGLGGRSLLELAETGDTASVLTGCRDMFAFEAATA